MGHGIIRWREYAHICYTGPLRSCCPPSFQAQFPFTKTGSVETCSRPRTTATPNVR